LHAGKKLSALLHPLNWRQRRTALAAVSYKYQSEKKKNEK
jgi:hypothetical protein